jgi:sugar/nucleoside kinase (ribokinase family)
MSAARRGIVTAGTWCADHNKMVEFWPAEEMLAEILGEERLGGGSACNLALDIKQLDPAMPVETIGLVGADEDGRLLLALADGHGIDRTQLRVTNDAPTEYTDAYASRRTGRRTHIFYPGAASLLTPDHFDLARTRGRILHLGLPGIHKQMDGRWGEDANGWVVVLRQARAAGLETNLELCSIPVERLRALARPCLPHLDLLLVNDFEIGAIAGAQTAAGGETDIARCLDAAKQVMAAGAMRLVVVHFPHGAVALTRAGEVFSKPSLRVPESEIVGANGAGDAFAAGFLYGHHEGWAIPDSLALAHAAAAASLRGMSTTGTVETWRRCLELAAKWGERTPI